eukprot:TRINITY_DN994_c0_g1_i1.p1 TRINITY_DN994_c0_g1~~TRINITY_DN994_c0_g1_i1.p1  ORF type:complete len:278 (-),score=55.77 TRINITY_DN994_c0_g1_i1:995-1828(-)
MATALVETAPTKTAEEYRNFTNSARNDIVSMTYKLNHTFQTYDFVKKMFSEYTQFKKGKMNIWDAISKLDAIVDESDPDAEFPQIYHALQTGERLRQDYPDEDWLHLVGLIHDLGKILALPEFGGLPQWAVVGDTFVVGCKHSDKICYNQFFSENPDSQDNRYNTDYGCYTPNCGLDNVLFSWGHDEYLYRVLLHNGCSIPPEGLNIIRLHSFYPWHREGAYKHLMNEQDETTLEWVKRFSKADLYSKTTSLPDVESLRPYYEGLINKYFPNPVLEW